MYTYNVFIYGHDLSKNDVGRYLVEQLDYYFSWGKGDNTYVLSTNYRGSAPKTPISFGIEISDDDDNPSFLKTVRNADALIYKKEYEEFIYALKKELLTDADVNDDPELMDTVIKFMTYLDTTEPEFYLLKCSS
jgi:hypothetical protein